MVAELWTRVPLIHADIGISPLARNRLVHMPIRSAAVGTTIGPERVEVTVRMAQAYAAALATATLVIPPTRRRLDSR